MGAVGATRTTRHRRIGHTDVTFEVSVWFARFGFAYLVFANPRFGIFERIAVVGSSRMPVGASSCTVDFACACCREMVAVGTRRNDARSTLAIASSGVICRVTIRALRAAMVVEIDTGIVVEAGIARARAQYTLPISA